MATTFTLSPQFIVQPLSNTGALVPGGSITTYVAGTGQSMLATTYQTSTGTANTNPIVLDAFGRVPAAIYLAPGQAYDFVFKDATGSIIKTQLNVLGIPAATNNVDISDANAGEDLMGGIVAYLSDGEGSKIAGKWYPADSANPYSSTTAVTGMVINDIATGTTGVIRTAGEMPYGAGGLVVGATYYIGTAGAVTSTAPVNSKIVGQAMTSSLLVSPYPPPFNATNIDIGLCEHRLTLTSGTPITSSPVTAATSVYLTPYRGNRIALYDGSSAWNVRAFTEITISLMGLTASKPYDVFAYDNAGVVACETLAWTNATTRATALTLQNGVYVKSGATTRRYVGTIYINGSGGQTDNTVAKRYVYNYPAINRVRQDLLVEESTSSWTYTSATIRQANASTANKVEVMQGLPEEAISLMLSAGASGDAQINIFVGIGEDSTTAKSSAQVGGQFATGTTGVLYNLGASLAKTPAVGYHFYAWLEADASGSGTATFYGTGAGSGSSYSASGIVGTWAN